MPITKSYTTLDPSEIPSSPNATATDDEGMVDIINEIRSGEASHLSLEYYIHGLIERGLIDDAVRFAERLIEDDIYYSGFSAEYLYDTGMPLANDQKWTELMAALANSEIIYHIEATGSLIHDNHCGEWIPGHHSPSSYKEYLKENFLVDVQLHRVTHGYLRKHKEVWEYVETPETGTLPITTCLDDDVLDALDDHYLR